MLHSRIFLEDPGYREEHFTTCEGDRCAKLSLTIVSFPIQVSSHAGEPRLCA